MVFFGFPKRGTHEVWVYRALMDEKTCEACGKLNNSEIVVEVGNEDADEVVHRIFEFAEQRDKEFFWANVHFYCRCFLEKVPNE